MNTEARFVIRAGTRVLVQPISGQKQRRWDPYITKIDLGFDRYDDIGRNGSHFQFRHQGWFILVYKHLTEGFWKHTRARP